jgi:tRNA threonylcarbamoyl adenosine modification protein YjeE
MQRELLSSSDEMILLGKKIGANCCKPTVFALYGTLGAGKTTLAKGIISSLTGVYEDEILSPTFQYLALYEQAGRSVAHFDLYRLSSQRSFVEAGFCEFFTSSFCIIEWPGVIESLLPCDTVKIQIEIERPGRSILIL